MNEINKEIFDEHLTLFNTNLLTKQNLNIHISQGEKESFTVIASYVNVQVIAL